MRRDLIALIVGNVMLWVPVPGYSQEEGRLAELYGFQPLEIYKLDDRISNLRAGDLDGDGVDDLAVANNGRSRIDLLLSKPAAEGEAAVAAAAADEPNELMVERRMRLVSVPVNREIVSLKLGDFNSDGRLDLAYYGNPAEMQVLFNEGEGRFSMPRRFATGEAVTSTTALVVEDLDGDGRDDLALLTEKEVVICLQGEGGLGELERWPHAASSPTIMHVGDLDGDGRTDLILVDQDTEAPVRVRFREASGSLGPEERFAVEEPRAVAFAEVDGTAGEEVLTIDERSGRARVLKLEPSALLEEGGKSSWSGRAQFFPMGSGDARGRSLDLGDVDGDGKTDVVATDPSRAQVTLYLQGEEGLGAGKEYPSLSGGQGVEVVDLDGDKRAEVLVLSPAEKQVGLCRLTDGRLSFPQPLPTRGDPVAITSGDLDGDGKPEILYVTPTEPGEQSEAKFALKALKKSAAGEGFEAYKWGDSDHALVPGLNGAPPALLVCDPNQDKRLDVLVFNSYSSPVLLTGRESGPPVVAPGGAGPLVDAGRAAVFVKASQGDDLLVAQNNYARRVRLDEAGRWVVKDQFNSGQSSARVEGVAMIDVEGDGRLEVALFDQGTRSVLWLGEEDGVYRPRGNLKIGSLDFQGLEVADFDGDGRDDLLVMGTDRFAVVLTGRSGPRLKSVAEYGSQRRDGHLADLAAGDLNGDGLPEVLVTDSGKHFMEILATRSGEAPVSLKLAIAFAVFEAKAFRGRDAKVEPREMVLGDVDGDGLTDFALVVHDRVLVYRQDPGVVEKPQ